MKFNFDKFMKPSREVNSEKAREDAHKREEEDTRRRNWLLQFRERWQNRIRYTGGRK